MNKVPESKVVTGTSLIEILIEVICGKERHLVQQTIGKPTDITLIFKEE